MKAKIYCLFAPPKTSRNSPLPISRSAKPDSPCSKLLAGSRATTAIVTLCEWNLQQLKWKNVFDRDFNTWREEWRAAFDVSAVTSRFSAEYETHFRAVEASVKGFEPSQNASDGERQELEEQRNAWTQKLFNRLLFVAFVQKKGWMTPPPTAGEGRSYLESLWLDYKGAPRRTG